MDKDVLRAQIAYLKVVERAQAHSERIMTMITDGAESIEGFDAEEMRIVVNLQIKRFSPESRRRVRTEIALLEAELAQPGAEQ